VDMQNFFLDSKCMDHPNGLKAVGPTIKAIEKCRELGIQIIWLNWGLTDGDLSTMPAAVQRGFMNDTIQGLKQELRRYIGLGSDLGDGKGRVLFAGSWNADIYPPLKTHVKSNDLHCAKNRMSGLWSPEQPLWKTLKAKDKNTLLFTGVNTDQCVLGTFVDGYNAGWNCILVDDCCGTTTIGAKEVTFHNIATSYGFVTDSASLLGCKVG
jgi:nicotinamidase-related amidase